jgi:hypothetical protein
MCTLESEGESFESVNGSMNARFHTRAIRFTCRESHQSDRMRTCLLDSNGYHGAKSQAAGRRTAGLEGVKMGNRMEWRAKYGGSANA